MLRVEGNIGEVRADALRFTEAEASELFAEALDLDLEVDQVTRLQARTEGWAAGLVLAALSLRGHTESEKFVATFAGDDRNVVDFLGSEVLGGLSDDVRTFLLQTSVLDSLCADLCDEVRGAHDSASLLSEIERSNLFLVPLDTTRGWYRYHHLFAGLLRFELAQGNATEVPTLHRRAAAWLSKNGQISQAIRHAILAGDFTDAGDMIASNWPAFLQQGQLASVSGWLNRLPADAVAADARLCLTQAWIAVNEGRIDDVRTWSDAAERAAAQVSDTDEASSLEAAAGMLACIYEYLGGDLNRAVEAANTARSLRSDENSPWRSVGCPVLGIAQFWSADLTGEESTLEQAIRRAGPAGNHIAIIHAQACLAVRHAERGEWGQANRLAQTAIDHGEEHGLEEHWTIAMAHTALGKVLSQRGQFDDAEIAARRGAALSGQGVAKVEKAYSLLVHATAQNALGQHAAARALVHDAREEIASCPNPGVLTEMLAASERGLRVKVLVGGSGRNELTERELAVLQMFESSLSLREIAAALFVSLNTVKTHAKGIYRKLGTSSREEAVAKARELGLTS